MAHVGFADPFDEDMRKVVTKVAATEGLLEGEGVKMHNEGTLICMGKSRVLSWVGIDHKPNKRFYGRGPTIQHSRRERFVSFMGWSCD